MYHYIKHHLCIVLCSPPQAKSPYIAKWLIITPFTLFFLLLPFPTPLFLWQSPNCCLYSSGFFSLVPSTFSPRPHPFPSDSCQSVFCIYKSVSISFINLFHSLVPHKSEIIWHLPFTDWLISLSIMLSRSIHAVTTSKVSFFMAI